MFTTAQFQLWCRPLRLSPATSEWLARKSGKNASRGLTTGLVFVLLASGTLGALGCAGKGPLASPGSAPTVSITEFVLPDGPYVATGLAAGPDGNVWFTAADSQIGRIAPTGQIIEFALPSPGRPGEITAGPDGNLWFTASDPDQIGRITPAGAMTEFPLLGCPAPLFCAPKGITTGPDGNLWFTEWQSGQIGRMTPKGTLTVFPLPWAGRYPDRITSGPDGNLWFTEGGAQKLGRITPSGAITEFPLPDTSGAITRGPDHTIWFVAGGGTLGRIRPSGQITWLAVPSPVNLLSGITTGLDGNLWFIGCSIPVDTVFCHGDVVGRITPNGRSTLFPLPTTNTNPGDITAGPDGNLWFLEGTAGNKAGNSLIGRITLRR